MTTTASVMIGGSTGKGEANYVRSFVKIDSIYIDLGDKVNAKSYTENCNHFSIREYVSDVRKKDWKLCWPFASDDEKNKSNEQNSSLPPLTSQSLRRWSCQSCLREDDHRNFDNVGNKSSNDCTSELPLPDDQQARKTNIVLDRTESEAHASTDTNINNIHQDKKDEDVAEACTNFTGPENGSSNQAGHELPGINYAPPDINLNVLQERPINYDTTAPKCVEMDRSSTVNLAENCRDVELSTPLVPCKKSTENGKIAENNEPIKASKRAVVSSVPDSLNDGLGYAVKDQNDRNNVCRVLDERDRGFASSEGVEIVGSSLHATSSGLQRRRTRKVRLLTELLGNNGDSKTEQVASEASPSKAANTESAGTGFKGYVPQSQVSVPENYRENNKKRKLPRDEERRLAETISQVDFNKQVENSKKSEEIGRAITGTELEFVAKNRWSNNGIDSMPINEKKKKSKKSQSQTVHARSYVLPLGDGFPNQACEEVGFPSEDKVGNGISFRPMNHVYPLTDPRKDKKSTSCKNKNKATQVDSGQSSRYPWGSGFLQKSPSVWSDEDMQTGPMTVSFRQPDAATIDTGLQLSLGGFLAPENCNKRYNNRQFGDGISPLSWQESTRVDEPFKRNVEKNYITGSSIPADSDPYAILSKQGIGEFRSKFVPYNRPVFNAKQKNKSPMEEDFRSLGKQLDISGASNCPKPIKPKPHSTVWRKHGDKIATNMSDHGASDDIPMEIVELMAQIQYERRQENPENSEIPYKTTEGRNSQMLDYEKAYCTERFIIPNEASKRANSEARKGRKNSQPVRQKPVDYFANGNGIHLDNGHLGQTQKKPSPSTSECSCAQNCKWNANIVGHGFFNPGSVPRGSCNTCPTEVPAQHWPSRVSVPKPTRYNGPQNGPAQRPNMHMFPNAPMFLQKGDNGNIGSETFGPKNTENSRGSLDLYSNETIPAMHLLSLMDAGMPSGTSIKRDPPHSISKEYPQIPIGHSKSREHHVKQPLPVKPHDFFPVNPMVNPSSSSFFHEKGFGVGSLRKAKAQKRAPKPSSSHFPSGGFLHSHVGFPLQPFSVEKSTELKLETPNHTGAFRPPKRNPETLICSVNRNPADFSTPEPGNEYMIKGEDLKFRKQRKRRVLVTEVQQKRQRSPKCSTEIVQERCPV